jgi:hypothetical protein
MTMFLLVKSIAMSIIGEKSMRYNLKGEVKTVVGNAVKGYQKGRRAVQNAAIVVLMHAAKHGDYSQAQVLCEGVGNKSLVKFFEDFGGLVVDAETKSFANWKGADYIRENFEAAKGQMYWEYKAENIWKGNDDLTNAKALIAKHNAAVKHLEEHPEDAGKVAHHPALIEVLANAVEEIEAA